MGAISPNIILMFLGSVSAQIFGLAMMPLSQGMTQPIPTIAMAAAYVVGIGLLTRIAYAGVDLSLLVPVLSATVPLAAIALGVIVYGESASLAKVGTLVVACALIGVTNIF